MQLLNITVQLLNIAVQLENNCTATNGKIYTGYAIKQLTVKNHIPGHFGVASYTGSRTNILLKSMYLAVLCSNIQFRRYILLHKSTHTELYTNETSTGLIKL